MVSKTRRLPAAFSASVVHWFRRDLRLRDNAALNAALNASAENEQPLIPLYVIDPSVHGEAVCGRVRLRFILECVDALQKSLAEHGLRLRVAQGDATKVVPLFARDVGASAVFFERELHEGARKRDEEVTRSLGDMDVGVEAHNGLTMYDPDWLLNKAEGDPPTSMGGFLSLADRVGPPPRPKEFAADAARSVPKENDDDANSDGAALKVPTLEDLGRPSADEDEDDEAIPEGVNRAERLVGGEDAAQTRLENYVKRDGGAAVREFSKPHTSPAAVDPRATTELSAYLAVGALSSRAFYHAVLENGGDVDGGDGGVQTTLRGQLLWREHFWQLAYATPNFEQMRGNPICRQIAWRQDDDDDNEELLRKWRTGRTGYPWIDALMTQLRVDGFVHHLGRHSVACFLTRGDLWLPWEDGLRVFQQLLIDHDHALNAANWMWLSCSAFFNQYFRVYSPVSFAKKWDKDGNFIRRYVPALRRMPTKWIFEPWKAPRDVQKHAGCIIGKDYPEPIVDHNEMRKQNIDKMKVEFKKGRYGSPSNEDDDDDQSNGSDESREKQRASKKQKREK